MCVPVNKENEVKEILSELMNQKKKVGCYSQKDIETAIMACRGSDGRTIRNWWRYLWRLDYFIQTQPDIYQMNLEKVVALEMPIPLHVDPKQRKLF